MTRPGPACIQKRWDGKERRYKTRLVQTLYRGKVRPRAKFGAQVVFLRRTA